MRAKAFIQRQDRGRNKKILLETKIHSQNLKLGQSQLF